jgi:uncharacterized metal-binding protein
METMSGFEKLTKGDIEKLYNSQDYEVMRLASKALLPGKSRIDEIKVYARSAGIRKIGIAHCVSVQKEADKLSEILSEEFEIYSVNCKIGHIAQSEFLGNNARGISCNPSGQAEHLGLKNTELNITMGLCIGHDILFNQKSQAPVTTLIVKDRQHQHNPYKVFE